MGNTFLFIYDRIEASNKEILIYGCAENRNIFIRIAQRKKNLTQEELGEQIGVTIKLFPVGKTGTIYRPLKFFKY